MSLISGNEGSAIIRDSRYGPVFGAGHDLSIVNNSNASTGSSSVLGVTYQCPPGQKSTFFTGAKNFTVTDFEVFGLQQ